MKLRLLSGVLAASMVLSLYPVSAFAEYTGEGISHDAVTAQEPDADVTLQVQVIKAWNAAQKLKNN